ncbi:hypothetical protein K438DRAFT_2011867 [Mycena galopus ATCC 62051]|nr:hypothetical protein K438DRAFT_2011867 [Mycena galopus ATCC 62051]
MKVEEIHTELLNDEFKAHSVLEDLMYRNGSEIEERRVDWNTAKTIDYGSVTDETLTSLLHAFGDTFPDPTTPKPTIVRRFVTHHAARHAQWVSGQALKAADLARRLALSTKTVQAFLLAARTDRTRKEFVFPAPRAQLLDDIQKLRSELDMIETYLAVCEDQAEVDVEGGYETQPDSQPVRNASCLGAQVPLYIDFLFVLSFIELCCITSQCNLSPKPLLVKRRVDYAAASHAQWLASQAIDTAKIAHRFDQSVKYSKTFSESLLRAGTAPTRNSASPPPREELVEHIETLKT